MSPDLALYHKELAAANASQTVCAGMLVRLIDGGTDWDGKNMIACLPGTKARVNAVGEGRGGVRMMHLEVYNEDGSVGGLMTTLASNT